MSLLQKMFGVGTPVLVRAADRGNLAKVKRLVSKSSIDLEAKNHDGDTALMAATRSGHLEVARTLIRAGADVNAKRADGGDFPLFWPSYCGNLEIVQELIVAGADVNLKGSFNQTALIAASKWDRTQIVRALIAAGANVKVKDAEGWTALMHAAILGKCEVAKILIAAGASLKARSNKGDTAFLIAKRHTQREFIKLLEEAEKDEATGGAGTFIVPDGRFTKGLVSADTDEFAGAITRISTMAQAGDRSGLDELETVIVANARNAEAVKFYVASGMRSLFGLDNPKNIATLVAFAEGDSILNHIYEVQSMFSSLSMTGQLPNALDSIRETGGFKEARSFELLFSQLNISTKYIHRAD